MKCRHVACIWSGAPPSHRVTATAALAKPATLYTGGYDGSIIWWNLSSSSDTNLEVTPIAMLCGHAAPIADLGICYPIANSGDGKTMGHPINVAISSTLENCGALVSACTDGVLCIWSRSSGHCRRRRKLPPWVGSPTILRVLPSNPRYVCIGCCLVDSVHVSENHSIDSKEGAEFSRKPSMCAIIIVDTYTLTISHTVFHGSLSIGPLKFMAVVPLSEDQEKPSVLIADSFGRLQLFPISKECHPGQEDLASSGKISSQCKMAIWEEGLVNEESVLSMVTCDNIVALVLKQRCIFRLLTSGKLIGEISFADKLLCLEHDSTQLHVKGGIFLDRGDAGNMLSTKEDYEVLSKIFAVWSNKGSAMIYHISYANDLFRFVCLGEIPAASYPTDVRLLISFTQLRNYLLRVESVCFSTEEPLQWRPHLTVFSLHQEHEDDKKLQKQFRMLGEGVYSVDLISSSSLHYDDKSNGLMQNERVVSSSMVISENLYVPYAVVYGFSSGEIEVVRFNLFHGLHSPTGSSCPETDSILSTQYFSGHTGAVLCLAAHRMVAAAKGWSFNHVLISGSMDCTVRVWDLETGDLVTVLHHHVAPVRQIILPPVWSAHPWNDCFLSVGEDLCVALSSLETSRVERIFPGHPYYPEKVVWDGARGYIACLCRFNSRTSDAVDVLYIWDVKTGARERVLRGMASHSMFDHFCKGISRNSISGTVLNGNTSVSSLLLPLNEDESSSRPHLISDEKGTTLPNIIESSTFRASISNGNSRTTSSALERIRYPIKCSCPFPGIATLSFGVASLMFPRQKHELMEKDFSKKEMKEHGAETPHPLHRTVDSFVQVSSTDSADLWDWSEALEESLIRFGLSFLHLWDIDTELDQLLITEMKLKRPANFIVASGLQGDRGSLTLTFPGLSAVLELWKSSSEFCAMRSLAMVSLAQCLISLSHPSSSSAASSALAAFYTRNFADKFPDVKPPLLQLLVSFWQDESEHVRMAARSLFHCAASRAIPVPLRSEQATGHAKIMRSLSEVGVDELEVLNTIKPSTNVLESDSLPETKGISHVEDTKLVAWLESFEMQDWVSCVGRTSQDAMASHIIVAAALAIWYPSLVKPTLATLVVHPLMKLVMAMNEKYSSTAAELLAEGMERIWKACIASEIPRLIADIFFQIECMSGPSANSAGEHPAVPASIRETLVGILLPSLAIADIHGFLTVAESQIWSTASDSPVHLVSLMTLIRVVRGSPRNVAQYLDKVVNFILQTMDPGNSVMRKTCLQSSMAALKEIVRVFPMVALNDSATRLAVGDAVGEVNNATIRVYDMQSVTKLKVLDASGPPGLPSLLSGTSEMVVTTMISALSFSPDGEGLVAFSEHGLMIRWWSLGSVWWEKLSRNFVPVQCTKVIFVPPWEGLSPTSSRSSVMATVMGLEREAKFLENIKNLSHMDRLRQLIHNLDLSYRLEWVNERKVLLERNGHELGTFQL